MNNKPSNFNTWIEKEIAVEIAKAAVTEFGLSKSPKIANALKYGHPEKPLLVERLDKPGFAYYLISWRITEGVIFIVELDASNGNVLEVRNFPTPTPSPFLSPDEALDYVKNIINGSSFETPYLVWQPCKESTSPMNPFYKIIYDDGAIYVGMHKNLFHNPTPLVLG